MRYLIALAFLGVGQAFAQTTLPCTDIGMVSTVQLPHPGTK